MDEGVKGADSDHNIVVFAPLLNVDFHVERKKKVIKTRPLPDSAFGPFERDMQFEDWREIYLVANFHKIIRSFLDKSFPKKVLRYLAWIENGSHLNLKKFTGKCKENTTRNEKAPSGKTSEENSKR